MMADVRAAAGEFTGFLGGARSTPTSIDSGGQDYCNDANGGKLINLNRAYPRSYNYICICNDQL